MTDQSTFEVRIPERYLDMLHEGELTPAMLLTLTVLYKWGNWSTGRVKACSAKGLQSWTHKAYSERTFSESLRKLEQMGEITRKMTHGSHDDYPVILHNYKTYDDAGSIQTINLKQTRTWEEIENAQCDEDSDETSYEPSDEGSDETSDKVLSENLSQNVSQTNLKPCNQSINPSINKATTAAPSALSFLNDEYEPMNGNILDTQSKLAWVKEHLSACFPGMVNLTMEQLRLGYEIMKITDAICCYPEYLVTYRRKHGPAKLEIHSVRQLYKAVTSDNSTNSLIAQYTACELEPCKKCKALEKAAKTSHP